MILSRIFLESYSFERIPHPFIQLLFLYNFRCPFFVKPCRKEQTAKRCIKCRDIILTDTAKILQDAKSRQIKTKIVGKCYSATFYAKTAFANKIQISIRSMPTSPIPAKTISGRKQTHNRFFAYNKLSSITSGSLEGRRKTRSLVPDGSPP